MGPATINFEFLNVLLNVKNAKNNRFRMKELISISHFSVGQKSGVRWRA